ncbi:hypothetical protein MHK_004344 [Candidatus Magnetomorum sp. HK-1]|nr:hypothetical protein MHK_004344 [Candidatus Magnetomorum sp. HK-1]
MFNPKQIELSNMLFNKLKEQFPEIEFVSLSESAENRDNIWVNIKYPNDEDRQLELYELSGDISTDILLDYGYSINTVSAL